MSRDVLIPNHSRKRQFENQEKGDSLLGPYEKHKYAWFPAPPTISGVSYEMLLFPL